MARILIADDEQDFRESAAKVLSQAGHAVRECASGDEAEAELRKESYDVVLTDLRMPGRGGIDVLKEAASRLPDAILIVFTAYATLDTAIDSLRLGAHDFILKPLNLDLLVSKVARFLDHQATLAENRFLRRALQPEPPAAGLVGLSDAIRNVRRLIGRVAPTDSTALITGETGTGKEVVARAIHQAGPRAQAPFVAINCGSIPETLLESELFGHVRGAFTGADRDKKGLFEVAGAGTLLLDEIGEMPTSLQPKLLRVLEAREILRVGSTTPVPIAARIIAATHRALPAMIEAGRFRSDLYYRLNVFEIPIPPLRERPEDVAPLAAHLLDRICRRSGRTVPVIEPEARRAMERYRWPGNVRELANVLERALILTDAPRITFAELPGIVTADSEGAPDALEPARDSFERIHIRRVLARCGGDKKRAADLLQISLASLYRKLGEKSPAS